MISGVFVSDGQLKEQKMSKLSITTKRSIKARNPHAGEFLQLDLIEPIGLSQNALARAIKVSPRRINEIIHGKRAITADTDVRLCRFFGYAPGFFLRWQMEFDLTEARESLGKVLDTIVPYKPPATKRAA
jgi:antitoxin HigA-1